MAILTTQGFDFGKGLLGEARSAMDLMSQAQRVQSQQLLNQQAQEQAQRQAQIRGLLGPQPVQQPIQPVGQELLSPPIEQPPVEPQQLSQEERISMAQKIDPAFANQTLKSMGLDDASKRAEASRFAADLETTPYEMREQKIKERANKLQSEGRDPKDTLELLDLNPQQQDQSLLGLQLMDLSTKERFGVRAAAAKAAPGVAEVQRSVILDDGTVQIVRKDGTVEVKQPGALEKELVRRGQEAGVDLQQRRAQGRETGKGTAKFTDKTFDQTNKLRANNDSLRQVIESVRGGAETGPLAARFPSFRAESIRLDRLRNQLGLDVVGSVTFGALSEGELNLALSTALPTGLEGPELIKWAEDKIAAQEKLANYMENQAIFLSDRGKTRADWLKFQKEEKMKEATPEAIPETGTGVIRFDRSGRRIQ